MGIFYKSKVKKLEEMLYDLKNSLKNEHISDLRDEITTLKNRIKELETIAWILSNPPRFKQKEPISIIVNNSRKIGFVIDIVLVSDAFGPDHWEYKVWVNELLETISCEESSINTK